MGIRCNFIINITFSLLFLLYSFFVTFHLGVQSKFNMPEAVILFDLIFTCAVCRIRFLTFKLVILRLLVAVVVVVVACCFCFLLARFVSCCCCRPLSFFLCASPKMFFVVSIYVFFSLVVYCFCQTNKNIYNIFVNKLKTLVCVCHVCVCACLSLA